MNITILNNGSEPLSISHTFENGGGVLPLNPGKFATLETEGVVSVEEMKAEVAA